MASFIYVIGAQCTGKTTLIGALHDRFRTSMPSPKILVIPELARGVLRREDISGADVQAGHHRAMQLQLVILQKQFEAEKQSEHYDLVLSDRSGLDPIAYSAKYGGEDSMRDLANTQEWAALRTNMKESVVVLCEPVTQWLTDDGERLMPSSHEEWFDLHRIFLELLEDMAIPFTLLPASLTNLDARVSLIVSSWERKCRRGRT